MPGGWQQRSAMLLGGAALDALTQKRVAVFGLGGVGGHACEALARAGIGALDLFDRDVVAESNLNRQLVALRSTLGQPKVAVMAARIADINPGCKVRALQVFYSAQTARDYPLDGYDYVVDAIDTVSAKIELVVRAEAAGVPLVSVMGTGNKLHPELLELTDLYATSTCPLARVMRRELKKHGVAKLQVVCSREAPLKPVGGAEDAADATGSAAGNVDFDTKDINSADLDADICDYCTDSADSVHSAADFEDTPEPAAALPKPTRKDTPGSVSFVPAAAGLIAAGAAIRELISG